MLPILQDKAGQPYIDIPYGREFIRVTRIEGGNNNTAIRIQIRDENGHLRPGPEIDYEQVGRLFTESLRLITSD